MHSTKVDKGDFKSFHRVISFSNVPGHLASKQKPIKHYRFPYFF